MSRSEQPEDTGSADTELAAAEREQEQSLARVEAGGIPLGAERRLRELAERGGSFTSDLSVGDFALCHQLGVRPLSQVMGSSIYQVGYQSTQWPSAIGGSFMFEMETLSEAWNDVRARALARLAQEAGHVQADAVIGVEMRTNEHDWAQSSIECVVIGTAVRHRAAQADAGRGRADPAKHIEHARPTERSASREPVMTELSVADYVKLAQAGIEPLGIVAWSSVFFVAASYSTQMMSAGGFTQNQELSEFTQGVYGAREVVVGRMTEQAAALNASGVVGVRIGHAIQRISLGGGRYERGGLMVTFHAIGTAIGESASASFRAPKTTIDLTT
jgi:uncharacterized protein YbjQ (UPF0145 family)